MPFTFTHARRVALTSGLCGLLAAGPALAQEKKEEKDQKNQKQAQVSEEDIARALAADQAAKAASEQKQEPPGPSGGPVATGIRAFQSFNPDISLIGDFALAGFSSDVEMLGGHDPVENGFNLQGLELAVGASVDPYFRFDSNIVFINEGVELEEAYGTTTGLPLGLQVRAGKFNTRFGRFNPTHPHAWSFADQPVVLGRFFGGDGNRNVGVEVSDLLTFLPWYVEVVLSAQDARGETARSFFGESEDPLVPPILVASPADLQYLTSLKQFFPLSDDLSLAWGVSGAFGPNPLGRTEIYGTDVYLKYRPIGAESPTIISLHAEYLARLYRTAAGDYFDHGAFAHLLWRFDYRWVAGLSGELVTAAAGHPLDDASAGMQQRYKANLTFYPTEFSRLRLQYDLELPGVRANTAHAVFLAIELSIGAHGAHKF